LSGGLRVTLTTTLERDAEATRVVTRGRPEGSGLLARLAAMPRFRRRLQARYERLAALIPAQIPADERLPLAVAVPPSA
jgi:hypothetical protein